MRAGWQTKQLGEILQLEYGKPLNASDRTPEGAYPVYGANGEIDRTNKFFYNKPSIIVGRKGSAGEINLTEDKFWPLDVTYFATFDEHQYDLRFLYYLLVRLNLPSLAKGVKPGINRSEVYSLGARIPPLFEQQRIVGILDAAFDGIATAKINAEQNLQNARALFESHLQSVFTQRGEGWAKKRLDDFFVIGSSKRVLKSQWQSEGVPFFRGREITKLAAEGFVDNELFISEDLYKDFSGKYGAPNAGDIMITAIGTIGNSYIVKPEDRFYFKDASVLWLKKSTEISSEYVNWWIKSPLFISQLEKGNGATVDTLTIQKLQNMQLVIPSSAEQTHIVEELDALSDETQRLESLYRRKLAALDELKKSLLHQAFSGAL